MDEWISKHDLVICYLQETHFRIKYTHKLRVKGWKKIFHANGNHKKAGVAKFISCKIDFKSKTISRNRESHYIMIKKVIQQEDIAVINVYASNIRTLKYMKQILTDLKAEIESNK